MTNRQFYPISVEIEGDPTRRRRVYRFRCATPGCAAIHDVSSNTHSGARAIEDITKTMKRAGWELGRGAAHDFCPQCMSDARKRKRENKPKAPNMTQDQQPPSPSNPPAAPEPLTLGIDDALVIAEKLSEVYAGKDKGYGPGWSDKRVAEDLNVPRDWVRQIREKRFGPAGDSEEARAVLAEAKAASTEAALMLGTVTAHVDRIDAIKAQIDALASEAAEIAGGLDNGVRDRLAECTRAVGQIERAIAAIEKVVV